MLPPSEDESKSSLKALLVYDVLIIAKRTFSPVRVGEQSVPGWGLLFLCLTLGL